MTATETRIAALEQLLAKERAAAAADAERERQQAAAEAARAQRAAKPRWDQSDVDAASSDETYQAYQEGKLTALGLNPGPPGQRENPLAGVVVPTVAQVRRWNAMQPWQRQRAVAVWKRQAAQQRRGGDAA